jgi:hypothetical protein
LLHLHKSQFKILPRIFRWRLPQPGGIVHLATLLGVRMLIPAPAIRWPVSFVEEGPVEDPAIMLSGAVEIGSTHFRVSALRMRDGLRMPDYRDGVPESAYEDAMDGMLDDVEDLVDSMEPELLTIGAAQYLLWMVPAPAPR